MAPIGIALRRTLILLVLAAGIGAALSWRRSQSTTPTPAEPPQWPEWPASAEPIAGSPESAVAHDDGSAPESHPIKVKLSSGIFHVPGGRFYDRTRPDRCYPTAAAAEADGYRRSKT
jgi:hypothetical protein